MNTELENEKWLLARAQDITLLAQKYSSPRWSGFLTAEEQTIILSQKEMPPDVSIRFDGGYSEAERRVMVAFPDWMGEEEAPIAVLRISGRGIEMLSHRDFLGAILNLGITRDKVGDILVGNPAYVYVLEDIESFIRLNLSKIGSKGVTVQSVPREDVVFPEERFEEITSTVPSLRTDAVLAAALSKSRGEVLRLMEAKKVAVNHLLALSPAKPLAEGDRISVRGFGKFVLLEIGGLSRKGRRYIKLKKFL